MSADTAAADVLHADEVTLRRVGSRAWRRPGARALTLVHFVDCVGNGVFFGTFALFLRGPGQLSSAQVGAVLGGGSLLGLVVSLVAGRMADRSDARRLLSVLLAGIGCCFLAMQALVSTTPAVVALTVVASALHFACPAPFVTLIAHNFDFVAPGSARAFVRSVGNLGMAAGAGLAAIALGAGGDGVLRFTPLVNGISFVLAAALLSAVSSRPTSSTPAQRARHALRERGLPLFVMLTALAGLHSTLLAVGFPLWISSVSGVPSWLAPTLVGVNTVMVFLLQVRVSASADRDNGAAVRATRRAAVLVAVAAAVMWVGGQSSAAVAVIVVGFVVVTAAELLQNAAFFHFTFSLGDDDRRGEYAAALHVSQIVESSLGPACFGYLLDAGHGLAWLVTAGVMVVVVAAYGPAFARLETSRAHA